MIILIMEHKSRPFKHKPAKLALFPKEGDEPMDTDSHMSCPSVDVPMASSYPEILHSIPVITGKLT